MNRALRPLCLAMLMLLIPVADAAACRAQWGGWPSQRTQIMSMREAGNTSAAYAAAAAVRGSSPDVRHDAAFLAGWIALRSAGNAEAAQAHFTVMAQEAQKTCADRPAAKAAAGYWMGRALEAGNRQADANRMYGAAAAYVHTFYGQMAASKIGVTVTRERFASVAGSFKQPTIYWHDPRTRRELVLAVIREESRFNPVARSHVGAQGMMQVMPDTARMVGRQAGATIDMRQMANNPDYNIAVGSRYLGDMLDRYAGNALLAAAAYNAGPGRADEWLRRFGDPRRGKDPVDFIESIPFTETRNYVKKVVGSYVTYIGLASR